jgi:prepilin-type N-terminal cleavage/methylation domain-containing protein
MHKLLAHSATPKRRGFTLVEVLIVTVVVAVIASITTISYSRTQADARDNTRAAHAALVASALEKYYDEHGEYPSPRALASTYGVSGDTVASKLSLTDKTTVLMPKASSSTTNSIAAALGTDDVLAYTATSTVGNDNCQTNAQAGCEAFTLQYKKESDGSTVTITSTNHTRPDDNTSPLEAPNKPTLAAAQSGATIVATSSATACATDPVMTANYSFRTQVGAGAWSAWSSWQTGTSYTTTSPTNGTTYSYQVHTRCVTASQYSDVSSDSDVASVTYYVAPTVPAVPSVGLSPAAGTIATSSTATISGSTCDYGTLQYLIDARTNDGTWSAGSWGTGTTRTVSANQGTKYGYRATARCVNGTQTSTGTVSAEATVITGVSTPGAPSVSGSGPTWSWTPSACSAGSSPYYYYQFSYWNGSGWVAQTAQTWINGNSVTNPAATSQGITYGINVWQYCWSGNVNSAWSAVANGGTFMVPVTGVQVVNAAVRLNSWTTSTPGPAGTYGGFEVQSFSGTCASGTSRDMALLGNMNFAGYQYETRGVAGWDDGTVGAYSSYDNKTNGGYPENGYYIVHHYINSGNSYAYSRITPGSANATNLMLTAYARCRNVSTNAMSGVSGAAYHYGIMYSINSGGNGDFAISCRPSTYGASRCAAGYGYNTQTITSSGLTACAVRSAGAFASETTFSSTATNWSKTITASGGSTVPGCWSLSYATIN